MLESVERATSGTGRALPCGSHSWQSAAELPLGLGLLGTRVTVPNATKIGSIPGRLGPRPGLGLRLGPRPLLSRQAIAVVQFVILLPAPASPGPCPGPRPGPGRSSCRRCLLSQCHSGRYRYRPGVDLDPEVRRLITSSHADTDCDPDPDPEDSSRLTAKSRITHGSPERPSLSGSHGQRPWL